MIVYPLKVSFMVKFYINNDLQGIQIVYTIILNMNKFIIYRFIFLLVMPCTVHYIYPDFCKNVIIALIFVYPCHASSVLDINI